MMCLSLEEHLQKDTSESFISDTGCSSPCRRQAQIYAIHRVDSVRCLIDSQFAACHSSTCIMLDHTAIRSRVSVPNFKETTCSIQNILLCTVHDALSQPEGAKKPEKLPGTKNSTKTCGLYPRHLAWLHSNFVSCLSTHLLSLADLGRETCLDCRDGPPRTTGVACDEVQTVLSLVELGIGRTAGLEGKAKSAVRSCNRQLPMAANVLTLHVTYSRIYFLKTFSICFCWKRPLMTKRLLPSTEPLVPNSANK